ncbi:MAG: ABC transporter permease [Candidatus Lokiarchaeota archaeon]|nr:ABC transporter permease [Candidatus Lokiarchaeota archaeon]
MARQAQNMIKYIIKRILMMVPILIIVLIITFLLSKSMDVFPVISRMAVGEDLETIQRMIEEEERRMGYDKPVLVQLFIYLQNFFTGNWGNSYVILRDTPVLEVIGNIFPKTIELMIVPIVIIPIIAVKLGVVSSTNKDKLKDTSIRFLAVLGAGFPIFFIGNLMQIFFGYYLKEFTYGAIDIQIMFSNTSGLELKGEYYTRFRLIDAILNNDPIFFFDTILHLFIPVICISFASLAGITRQTRSSMLDVMDQDYIRTARAKGVPEKKVINSHALRNALIPSSNLIITTITGSLLGSLFLEATFQYLGFGYYFVRSVFLGDYLLINGFLVCSCLIIIGGTLATDVIYTIIDPRITYT